MPFLESRIVRKKNSQYQELTRLMKHYDIRLNIFCPLKSLNPEQEIAITIMARSHYGENLYAQYAVAATYYPYTGQLRMAMSRKVLRCDDGLEQALRKVIDFLDWVTDPN